MRKSPRCISPHYWPGVNDTVAKSTKKIEGEESVHYIPPRRRRPRPKPKMQPPLTPMIDVTFQLLIFFLLAFQLRQPEGPIPASLPQTGTGTKVDTRLAKPIHIVIRPVGDDDALYEIGGYPTPTADPDEVYSVLQSRKDSMGPKVPVIIKPTEDVKWRFVIEAFNAAVRARLENVAFAPSSS